MTKLVECKGNSSAMWKLIKEIIPNQKSGIDTHEFQINENISDKAEEFNTFSFSQI